MAEKAIDSSPPHPTTLQDDLEKMKRETRRTNAPALGPHRKQGVQKQTTLGNNALKR